MRLESKTAIIVGAGQGPGTGMGNGRATALRFAQEGAKVMAVDREIGLAEETAALVRQAGGDCFAFEADVTKESAMAAMVADAKKRWGRIDVLHYNVGVSIAAVTRRCSAELTEQAFDNIVAVNLRGAVMACKRMVPVMRDQRAGCILMISSLAAIEKYPYVTYKATKAAMIAFAEQVAIQNAEYGVRANVILPGLMDTPMAVDTRARQTGKSRAEVAAMRDARVPLRRKMGTAWDVANAALFPPTRPTSSPASQRWWTEAGRWTSHLSFAPRGGRHAEGDSHIRTRAGFPHFARPVSAAALPQVNARHVPPASSERSAAPLEFRATSATSSSRFLAPLRRRVDDVSHFRVRSGSKAAPRFPRARAARSAARRPRVPQADVIDELPSISRVRRAIRPVVRDGDWISRSAPVPFLGRAQKRCACA
jgi:NAD(P)-dependent dehydrogenase (short-subunit alcohol dehydrogenase family)